MLRAIAVFVLVLSAGTARAQGAKPAAAEAPDLPEGYAVVDTVGRLPIFAKDKGALAPFRTELKAGLTDISNEFEKQFGLSREVLRVGMGENKGMWKDERRDAAFLVIFTDMAEFAAWETRAGIAGDKHLGAGYRNTVGVLIEGGKLTPEHWATLWHAFSHLFYRHVLWTGSPTWLDEGLAAYLSWANRKVKAAETQSWPAMIDRLRQLKAAGAMPAVTQVLQTRAENFSRVDGDIAWVLVHLLMTHKNGLVNDLVGALASLERCAVDRIEGVKSDLHRYATFLLTNLFGDEKKLQAAWDLHLDDILADPARPKKRTLSVGEITGDILPDFDGNVSGRPLPMTDPATGVRYAARRWLGSVIFRGPWTGRMSAVAHTEDRHDDRSAEIEILKELPAKFGQKERCDNESLPYVGGQVWCIITVIWSLDEGGVYRTSKRYSLVQ
ncbi:MAG: hypothetical protein HUU15_10465 [Candidatus Brocadiae bacterium]|nr:hypothetical protein [Candidatus Brocadiia bacterium]